jgi:hypothetical protein
MFGFFRSFERCIKDGDDAFAGSDFGRAASLYQAAASKVKRGPNFVAHMGLVLHRVARLATSAGDRTRASVLFAQALTCLDEPSKERTDAMARVRADHQLADESDEVVASRAWEIDAQAKFAEKDTEGTHFATQQSGALLAKVFGPDNERQLALLGRMARFCESEPSAFVSFAVMGARLAEKLGARNADLSAVAARAIAIIEQAGIAAMAGHDRQRALSLFEDGWRLHAIVDDISGANAARSLGFNTVELLRTEQRFDEAERVLGQIASLLTDKATALRVQIERGWLFSRRGDDERAASAFADAVPFFEPGTPPGTLIRYHRWCEETGRSVAGLPPEPDRAA